MRSPIRQKLRITDQSTTDLPLRIVGTFAITMSFASSVEVEFQFMFASRFMAEGRNADFYAMTLTDVVTPAFSE
jgi:hypothetical protein